MVTVPATLLEHLEDDLFYRQDLFDLLQIDLADQRVIYPTFEKAARKAKLKQVAAIAEGNQKVEIKVGETISIHAVNPKEIQKCAMIFAKDLPESITPENRKVLAIWATKSLAATYGFDFTVTLETLKSTLNPDGSHTEVIPNSTVASRHRSPFRGSYILWVQRYTGGKPDGNRKAVFPFELTDGQPYDFLSIKEGKATEIPGG